MLLAHKKKQKKLARSPLVFIQKKEKQEGKKLWQGSMHREERLPRAMFCCKMQKFMQVVRGKHIKWNYRIVPRRTAA